MNRMNKITSLVIFFGIFGPTVSETIANTEKQLSLKMIQSPVLLEKLVGAQGLHALGRRQDTSESAELTALKAEALKDAVRTYVAIIHDVKANIYIVNAAIHNLLELDPTAAEQACMTILSTPKRFKPWEKMSIADTLFKMGKREAYITALEAIINDTTIEAYEKSSVAHQLLGMIGKNETAILALEKNIQNDRSNIVDKKLDAEAILKVDPTNQTAKSFLAKIAADNTNPLAKSASESLSKAQ